MAIGATVHKVSLTIADMDRQYYQVHELTVAMHPSENDHRFIIRIIAFALNAHEQLIFTKGLGADDEPEVWQKSLAGDIELWIDFGQIDEKRIRRACGRAKHVKVYTYQERKAMLWWEQHKKKLARHDNLAWTIHETRNPFTEPFSCSGFGRAAQARSGIRTVFPTEQDSLQGKGARKDFVISWIIQAIGVSHRSRRGRSSGKT